jgi:hypothetical protein
LIPENLPAIQRYRYLPPRGSRQEGHHQRPFLCCTNSTTGFVVKVCM